MEHKTKQQAAHAFKKHAQDTGSIEVQVASLTHDIKRLTEHFKAFPKDINSKRGLMEKVSRRKSFLQYLERKDKAMHQRVIEQLEIRK